MKLAKLVLCSMFIAPLAVLNAQQGPDEFDGEEAMQPAPRGPMGSQMGPGGQFAGPQQRPQGIRKLGKEMRPQKGWDMPEAMEDRVMEIIKKNDPALAEKLGKLKTSNEKKYDATMAIAAKFLGAAKMAEDPSMEKDVVRGIGLEYDVRELSMSYEKASDSEKAKIKEQIKVKLNELFDIRTKGQELRIKKLESEVAELKKGIEARKTNKSKIVEQRLEQLIGNKYLSW